MPVLSMACFGVKGVNKIKIKGLPIIQQPLVLYGTPGRIRTYDLRIRSPLLYPAELQAHVFNLGN